MTNVWPASDKRAVAHSLGKDRDSPHRAAGGAVPSGGMARAIGNRSVSWQSLLELALAATMLVAGVWLYRRPSPEPDHYGSQGAVLLLILGAILAVHGLGLLRYHPSSSEVEAMSR